MEHKISIIPDLKRIPKFSKTFPGIFTVPFNFELEITEFLVEWKAPDIYRMSFLSSKQNHEDYKN